MKSIIALKEILQVSITSLSLNAVTNLSTFS